MNGDRDLLGIIVSFPCLSTILHSPFPFSFHRKPHSHPQSLEEQQSPQGHNIRSKDERSFIQIIGGGNPNKPQSFPPLIIQQ